MCVFCLLSVSVSVCLSLHDLLLRLPTQHILIESLTLLHLLSGAICMVDWSVQCEDLEGLIETHVQLIHELVPHPPCRAWEY